MPSSDPNHIPRPGRPIPWLLCLLLALPGRVLSQFPPKIFLQADFEKALPEKSESLSGEWQAVDGRLRQSKASGAALLLLATPDPKSPYTAKVRVRIPEARTGSEAGLALQVRDARNLVVFSLQQRKGGPYAVLRIQADRTALVGDQARLEIDLREWHELRAEVHGPHVYGYLDGRPVANYGFLGTPPPSHIEYKLWAQDPAYGQVGLVSTEAEPEFDDLEVSRQTNYAHIVTPQLGRRDAAGRLLPRQSYAETIRRNTEWMIRSGEVVDRSAMLEQFRSMEPYLISNFVSGDDRLIALQNGEFAFNHASFISNAVRYYVFSGDERALEMSRKVADWEIANSTPENYAAPFLPPSFVAWQKDGTWQGMAWGLEPDKAAFLGISYLKLYAATEEEKYKTAALRIAATLKKLQRPDGSWPFRIDPKTGETKHVYTESQLWYIQFFERIAALTGDKSYLALRDRAFRWLLDNPVKTNRWVGLYGDISSGTESYDHWIPLETLMYLLERRQENPEYLPKALGILDWLNRTLVVNPGFHAGVPGLLEQSTIRWVDSFVELRLGVAYARLWEATGRESYRDLAVQIGNSVTWCLLSDGKMRLGFYYTSQVFPTIPMTNDEYCEIMAAIPETAPRDENHLLRSSSDVRRIVYNSNGISYRTVNASEDILVVAGQPKSVTAGGKALRRLSRADAKRSGWSYDPVTGALRIRHQEPDVSVSF